MNEIAPLLEQLAAQLGTTVDYLWPLLVKQTQIDWVACMVVLLISDVVLLIIAKKLYDWKPDRSNDEEITRGVALCVTGSVFGFTAIGTMCQLGCISSLIIPEAETIRRLLESL